MNDIAAEARAPAAGPREIPASGWWQVLVRTYKESDSDNVSIIAAGVAFYAFLAFVPMMAALVLIYGLVAEPSSVVQHVRALTGMMPADAARLIGEQLMNISQTATSKKGFGLLLAILISLYGAMRGATSIVTALNIVYNVKESRGFLKTTLLAVSITLGAV
jgi:membrane protein